MHEKAIGRKPRLEAYLEGQGDVVIRLITGVSGVTLWVIGVVFLLAKSPRPSKYWLAVIKGLNLSYYIGEARLNTTCTHYGNLI